MQLHEGVPGHHYQISLAQEAEVIAVGPGKLSDDGKRSPMDVKKGDKILMAFPAGNRDPEHFERPDEFIIDRAKNRHAAFGLGRENRLDAAGAVVGQQADGAGLGDGEEIEGHFGVKRSDRQDMPPSSLAHSLLPISTTL